MAPPRSTPLSTDEIRKRLEHRSPTKVAEASGVHFQTVRAIRDGRSTHPTERVIEALSRYLALHP